MAPAQAARERADGAAVAESLTTPMVVSSMIVSMVTMQKAIGVFLVNSPEYQEAQVVRFRQDRQADWLVWADTCKSKVRLVDAAMVTPARTDLELGFSELRQDRKIAGSQDR